MRYRSFRCIFLCYCIKLFHFSWDRGNIWLFFLCFLCFGGFAIRRCIGNYCGFVIRQKDRWEKLFLKYTILLEADYKSALNRSSLFCLRIANPQERLADSRYLLRLTDLRACIMDLDTPSHRKYQRQKTECILYQENTPRNLNILCYDNIVISLLPLLSQWVEGTIGTTIVVITPTDGLRQTLVGVRCTRSEA